MEQRFLPAIKEEGRKKGAFVGMSRKFDRISWQDQHFSNFKCSLSHSQEEFFFQETSHKEEIVKQLTDQRPFLKILLH